MARKTVERNISYDDIRKIYYVSMDLGKDKEGRRVKRYQTSISFSLRVFSPELERNLPKKEYEA